MNSTSSGLLKENKTMMHDKIDITITEEALAQLLSYAMDGMREVGEYSPVLAHTFKELASKLPVTAWDAEYIHAFADSLNDTVDGPDEDYSFILNDANDYDDY